MQLLKFLILKQFEIQGGKESFSMKANNLDVIQFDLQAKKIPGVN